MTFAAPRPIYSVLNTNKGIQMPRLEDAIERYFSEKGEEIQ